jgi:hypothetical protein
MSEVDLTYHVPVTVTVDTEQKKVIRVVVEQEAVRGPDVETRIAAQRSRLSGDGEVAEAVDIAEGASWPAWEIGS